jgi:D-arabinono-1,4-lactone oxidase
MGRSAARNTGKLGWSGETIDPDAMPPIKRRDKCYEIFPKGGKLFGGSGLELAFPIERTIEIMDRLLELAKANDENRLNHTAPVSIRFVRAATAYASPQHDRTTAMFEVLMEGDRGRRGSSRADRRGDAG